MAKESEKKVLQENQDGASPEGLEEPDDGYIAELQGKIAAKIRRFSPEHLSTLLATPIKESAFVDDLVLARRMIIAHPDLYPDDNERKSKVDRQTQKIRRTWLQFAILSPNLSPLVKAINPGDRHFYHLILPSLENPKVQRWLKLSKNKLFAPAFDEAFLEDAARSLGVLTQGQEGLSKEQIAANFIAHQMFSHPKVIERIPDEILIAISEAYTDLLEARRSSFREKYPELVRSTKEHLYAAIESGKLPITREKVDEVFQKMTAQLGDPIIMQFDNQGGHYQSDTNTVFLRASLSEEQIPKIFMHEVLHALSGQSIRLAEEYTAQYSRIGLRKNNRYRWLNEGMTESLALEVLREPDSHAYPESRKLLKLLIADIDRRLFRNAYFEESLPESEIDPDWEVLMQVIEEQYGQRFLDRLDDFIKKSTSHGVKKSEQNESGVKLAVKKFTELKGKFPQFLKDWETQQS